MAHAARSRPTSTDVADRAGLSRSAVSQILNGHGERFPQETRDRVLAAAADLGYRPSRAGRALVNGVADLVVVVLPDITFGASLQDSLDIISAHAAAANLSTFVRFAGPDRAATLSAVLDLRPAAVIDLAVFGRQDRATIASAGISIAPGPGGPQIEDLNVLAGRLQARELLRVPGRRLVCALLNDDRLDHFGPQRLRGAAEEANRAGVAEPVAVRIPLDVAGAAAALLTIGEAGTSALGICCYNDDVAIAVLAAARRLALPVPEMVAVVGVGHTAVGQLVDPPLTSVAYDLPSLVRSLAGQLNLDDLTATDTTSGAAPPEKYVRLVHGATS